MFKETILAKVLIIGKQELDDRQITMFINKYICILFKLFYKGKDLSEKTNLLYQENRF